MGRPYVATSHVGTVRRRALHNLTWGQTCMPVNSAQELHDLVSRLGGQFTQTHHPAAQTLWSQADHHIEHVVQQAGTWIAREIESLHSDWQSHKRAIQDAESWFAHHGKLLAAIAQRPMTLASEVLKGAPSAMTGPLSTLKQDSVDVAALFGVAGIAQMGAGLLSGGTIEDLRKWSKTEGLAKQGNNLIKYFGHDFKLAAKAPGALDIVLGGGEVAYDVWTKGWGDGDTVKTIVVNGGGLVASAVAGPAGGAAWTGATMLGEHWSEELEKNFQVQEKSLQYVFGDPDTMSSAQAAQMVKDVSNPFAFGSAVGHSIWKHAFG